MILIFTSFIILWNSLLLKNTCIALFFIKPSVPASLHLYRKANTHSGTLMQNARATKMFTRVPNEHFRRVVNVLKRIGVVQKNDGWECIVVSAINIDDLISSSTEYSGSKYYKELNPCCLIPFPQNLVNAHFLDWYWYTLCWKLVHELINQNRRSDVTACFVIMAAALPTGHLYYFILAFIKTFCRKRAKRKHQ